MAQDWTHFKNHIVEGDARLAPAPTSADNGKVLKVVNGVSSWQKEGDSEAACCYLSSDGFMFVPAGKATVSETLTQVYRKQSFTTVEGMGTVAETSDHRYVRNSSGEFTDIDA